MDAASVRMLSAAICMAVGSLGPAIAIGLLGYSAMQAMGRNPEARGAITTSMILAIAFAEAVAIYALIVSIIIALVMK